MARIVSRFHAALLTGASLLTFAGTADAQQFQCGRKGGDFIFGLEARVSTIDQHVNNAQVTRNVSMQIFETLITRGEDMKPLLDLGESVTPSADGKTYTFKIRRGVKFHNGKTMTSADILASYERYKRVGVDRSIFNDIERWEAPDPDTFVMHLKEARPTFLETISVFTTPVIVIPSENEKAEPLQLPIVGTGPYRLTDFAGDSHVKLARFDGYAPNDKHQNADGFGGYKVACFDTVTFRMMPESQSRTAALEVGEIHGVEDVPTAQQKRLANNNAVKMTRLDNFWLHITYPNSSLPPTDNLKVRQAIQAVMDMDEIMEASSDGAYKLNPSFQFPGTPYYSESGKEYYNQKNKEKARRLLQEGGYKGEKIVLLTNREYPTMYNASVVMQEQLKSVGMNAELLILDWPTALNTSMTKTEGWNFFYTGWITITALGGQQSLRLLANPTNVHKPKDNQSDPVFMQHWNEIGRGATIEARKESFAKAQQRAFEDVMAIPFGVMPKVQAVRSNVEGFKSYYLPRMYNVWIRG
jgi:peptide/nickel transport system substrate-binding protein